LILKGIDANAALFQCLRKNGGNAETEEDNEDVEDAEAAAEAG
jgi:hypothetical protein